MRTDLHKLCEAVNECERAREAIEVAIAKLTSSGAPAAARGMLWETAKLLAMAHEALAAHASVLRLSRCRVDASNKSPAGLVSAAQRVSSVS